MLIWWLRKCSNVANENLVGKFNKVKQKVTVREYVKESDELKSFVLADNSYLTKVYFIRSFTSGLRGDIGSMLQIMNPKSLPEAVQLAFK